MPIMGGCSESIFGKGDDVVIDLRKTGSAASGSDVLKSEQEGKDGWIKWLFSSRGFLQNSAQAVPEKRDDLYATLFRSR